MRVNNEVNPMNPTNRSPPQRGQQPIQHDPSLPCDGDLETGRSPRFLVIPQ